LLAELGASYSGAGPVAVVTAHTEDDQAETLLMRLARGSGLDGLTGMSAQRLMGQRPKCQLVRPLLQVPGVRLRATLDASGISWIEDPSNESVHFERVRVRKAKAALAALGLTNDRIGLSARRLERSRAALDAATSELQAAAKLSLHGGIYASLEVAAFQSAPEDLRIRLMGRLVAAFGGQKEPVRLAKIEALVERLGHAEFEAATLGGTIVTRRREKIGVCREPGRSELPEIELQPGASAVWDRRFRVHVGIEAGAPIVVRALGPAAFASIRRTLEGAIPPARAAATTPSFCRHGEVVTAPLLSGLPGAPAAWQTGTARHCSAEFLW
jgi:tRNA(Ile)-lysidine synthase